MVKTHTRYVYISDGEVKVSISRYCNDAAFLAATKHILDEPHRFVVVEDKNVGQAVRDLNQLINKGNN